MPKLKPDTETMAERIMESCGMTTRPDIQIEGIENLAIPRRTPTTRCRCYHPGPDHADWDDFICGRCLVEGCECAEFGRALPGRDFCVSPSALKKFGRSVPNFAALYVFKTIDREPSSPDQMFGTLMHAVLLEPETVGNKFLGAPDCTRQSKEGKQRWAECEAQAAAGGLTVVTRDQVVEAVRCADAIMSHARARELVTRPGRAEQKLECIDEPTGLRLQRRFDLLYSDGGECDIKTTKNAGFDEFGKDAYFYGYHIASAFGKLVMQANGLDGEQRIIAVDKETYEVSIHLVQGAELNMGLKEVRKYLEELRFRVHNDDWSSRMGEERALRFPGWVYKQNGRY